MTDPRLDAAILIQTTYRKHLEAKYTLEPDRLSFCISVPEIREAVAEQANSFLRRQWNGRAVKIQVLPLKNYAHYYLLWDKTTRVLSMLFANLQMGLGTGALKETYLSDTLEVSFSPKTIIRKDSVFVKIKNLNLLEFVRNSNAIHAEIYQNERPPGIYVVEPMKELTPGYFTRSYYPKNFNQIRRGSDLNIVRCMRDVTKAVLWLHELGYIHRDIRPENFLLREQKDNLGIDRWVAYLADFDLIRKMGAPEKRDRNLLDRFDICMNELGLSSPYSDYYSLALRYLRTLTDVTYESLNSVSYSVYLDVKRGINKPAHSYLTSSDNLNPIFKQAWRVYIDVCKMSSHLYQELKDCKGAISKEKMFAAMKKNDHLNLRGELLALADAVCDHYRVQITI